jgi:hypothetical protein
MLAMHLAACQTAFRLLASVTCLVNPYEDRVKARESAPPISMVSVVMPTAEK